MKTKQKVFLKEIQKVNKTKQKMPQENPIPQSNPGANINSPEPVNEVKIYTKAEEAVASKKERASSDTTVFRGALMITNLSLGVTIFTFVIRATYFGLV